MEDQVTARPPQISAGSPALIAQRQRRIDNSATSFLELPSPDMMPPRQRPYMFLPGGGCGGRSSSRRGSGGGGSRGWSPRCGGAPAALVAGTGKLLLRVMRGRRCRTRSPATRNEPGELLGLPVDAHALAHACTRMPPCLCGNDGARLQQLHSAVARSAQGLGNEALSPATASFAPWSRATEAGSRSSDVCGGGGGGGGGQRAATGAGVRGSASAGAPAKEAREAAENHSKQGTPAADAQVAHTPFLLGRYCCWKVPPIRVRHAKCNRTLRVYPRWGVGTFALGE